MFFVARMLLIMVTICIQITLAGCGPTVPLHRGCHKAQRTVIYPKGVCVIHAI